MAYALLVVSTAMNISGIQKSSWVNMVFTTAQIGGLLLLVFAGITSPEFGNVLDKGISFKTDIFASVAVVFYVYTGYEHMATLAEEAKNPGEISRLPLYSVLFLQQLFIFSLSFPFLRLPRLSRWAGRILRCRLLPVTGFRGWRVLSAVLHFLQRQTSRSARHFR